MATSTAASAQQLPWQARLPFFYGWVIVAISFSTMFVTGGVQFVALSVLVVPMQDDLGWSRSIIFLPITIRSLIAAFGSPFTGRYMDQRYGALIMGVIGGSASGLLLILVAGVDQEWQFLLLFGVLGGVANITQPMAIASVIVPKWFVRLRGRAVAIAILGSSASAFALPLTLTFYVDAFGWRATWVLLGIATLLFTAVPAFFVRRRPEDLGLLPDGARDAAAAGGGGRLERSYTAGEAFRMKTTWLLIFAMTVGSVAWIGLPSNLVALADDQGFSKEVGAWAFTTYGLLSMTARFAWGAIAERTHVRTAVILAGLWGAVTVFSLTFFVGHLPLLFAFAGFSGFAIGGLIVLNPLIWATYFGREHLGKINGIVQPITTIGIAGGPSLMSVIHDTTDSYELGLMIIGLAWLLCAGAMYLARPSHQPEATPAGTLAAG
ncbi:MAG: MFS transporter [Dehalococcoidia bacterium]|nr:MFS transporter [Dehalococcoidia bacterium]